MTDLTPTRIELIKNNYVDVRNPKDKYKIIRLYQVISIKEFVNAQTGATVQQHTLGGYAENIDCIDQADTSWIDNTAKIFGNAKLINGAYLQNDAVVYDNATIDNSTIKDKAHVFGNAKIINSVIAGNADVRGDAIVSDNSTITNAAIIFGNSKVIRSTVKDGAICRDNAVVSDSILMDVSEVKKDAFVTHCTLSGRSIVDTSTSNATLDGNVDLTIISNGKD